MDPGLLIPTSILAKQLSNIGLSSSVGCKTVHTIMLESEIPIALCMHILAFGSFYTLNTQYLMIIHHLSKFHFYVIL